MYSAFGGEVGANNDAINTCTMIRDGITSNSLELSHKVEADCSQEMNHWELFFMFVIINIKNLNLSLFMLLF